MATKKKPLRKRVSLGALFGSLQEELEQTMKTAREHIPHPGVKGDVTEWDWIAVLREHLPTRYCVDKAFVVDSRGNLSQQLDLVIFDKQYGPIVFHRQGATYIPAESVYAVFEVKQTLNAKHVEYAIEKATSVRRLVRTSVPITSAAGKHDPVAPKPILAGILTYNSGWRSGFGTNFATMLKGAAAEGRLDIGCCLRAGAFNADYDVAPIEIEKSSKENALVSFFMTLLHRLQPLGTVTAIDLTAYGQFTLGKKHGT